MNVKAIDHEEVGKRVVLALRMQGWRDGRVGVRIVPGHTGG